MGRPSRGSKSNPALSRREMAIIAIGAAFLLSIICCCSPFSSALRNISTENKTITICALTDQYSDDGHAYMVYAVDNNGKAETYEVREGILFSPFTWRRSAIDDWNGLKANTVYNVKVVGWEDIRNIFVLDERTDLQPEVCPKR